MSVATMDTSVMSDEDTTIERGDVFITPDGPIKVLSITGNDVRVVDPTLDHPQNVRSQPWEVDRELLINDLEDGTATRGSVTVVEHE